MAEVRVVTDSAADLDRAVAAERGIAIVDLDVRLGEVGPDVTKTWSPEEFWQHSVSSSVLPETSAPSPGAFAATFEKAASEGASGVVCVTLSSKLSATYQAAVAGAEAVADSIDVTVVDSLTVTMAEGLVVLATLEAARRGGDVEAVARTAETVRTRTHVFGVLDTLDNLRKGGRIGGAQAFMGSLLSIKPVVEVRDGVVEAESRQRTRQRSFEYLVGKVRSAGSIARLAVVHAVAPDIDVFLDLLSETFPRDETDVGIVGPVIGTHCGPGTIGVCFELAAP